MKNIPVFILAGGLGTRISEETHLKPKPMIEIGETPILLHLMRWYYSFGFNDFVICGGYRSWEIKNFFLNYEFRLNHLVIDHRGSSNFPPETLGANVEQEKWRVRVIDAGLETMTGARLARAFDEIKAQDKFTDFALSYGDGLSNVDLNKELSFHLAHGRIGTVLGVPPVARFGELDVVDEHVKGFVEKPEDRQGLINGGFFFFKSSFRDYLNTLQICILEREPLSHLAKNGQLMMFKHTGFWMPMDTLRDKILLQQLWDSGKAPWAVAKSLREPADSADTAKNQIATAAPSL
jgi:glucose-1-phosphate cytidylyltransferase